MIALDARSGKSLWHFQTGGQVMASPMSYGVDGTQFIALASRGVAIQASTLAAA